MWRISVKIIDKVVDPDPTPVQERSETKLKFVDATLAQERSETKKSI